ncbi:MAG: BatD family protein [Gemmatimonadota bacterium]|nr:BatD family protein [Gemmatimonadota bacterium]MDH3422406.1 BatD family protein [Gemmatimonadota bacterium]
MRSAWTVFLLLAIVASRVGAQSSVATEVDATVVTVGDRITYTISVDHPLSAQARLPDSLALGSFEVLQAQALPVATTQAGARSTWTLTLAAFELGELELPPVSVDVVAADGSTQTLQTDRYLIDVTSVGVDESGDIRDIRGPLGIPVGLATILVWLLVPLLLAALLYVIVRRLRPRGEDVARPALGDLRRSAHEVALEALAALEASSLLDDGQVKEYHIVASDILRTYIEERFRVEALEMTTREVLASLSEVGADASFRSGLRTFLDACDLVKFAKARPDDEASHAALELGRRIIMESVPVAPTSPAEPVVAAVGEAS